MTSFPFLPFPPCLSSLSLSLSPPHREINEALPNCRCALEIYISEKKAGGGEGKGKEEKDTIDETDRERFVIP